MEVRGQGPKVKGQILIHSHTWLWTPYKVCTSRWTASVSPWLPVAQPCDTATAWQHRHIQWDKTTVEHSYPTKRTKTLHNVSINMKPLNHIKQKQTSNKLIRCRKHWYTQHTHNLTEATRFITWQYIMSGAISLILHCKDGMWWWNGNKAWWVAVRSCVCESSTF